MSAGWVRAILAGALIFAATLAARSGGLLGGPAALVAFVLVLVALPSSRQLSRRILLVGCLYFGWVPVLYWWDLPVGEFGRSTLLFATVLALLAAWIVGGRRPVDRVRLLIPRFRFVDAFPPLAGLVALGLLWDWVSAKSGASAMAVLTWGDDNVAHFAMVRSIRLNGVTADRLPPGPDGQTSLFDHYPQAFHGAVAALMEMTTSTGPVGAELEVVSYTRAVGLLVVGAVVLVAAGICALPALRRRPALAAPLVTLTTAAFVVGPGSSSLHQGFPNFLLACALVAAMAALVVTLARPLVPVHLAAIGGALVGVTHSWLLLLTLAAPCLLLILAPWNRARWAAGRRTRVFCAGVVAATAACCLYGLYLVSGVQVSDLAAVGGIGVPDLGIALLFPLTCLAVCLMIGVRRSGVGVTALGGLRLRTSWLVVIPATGLITAGALATIQLSIDGEVSYYFWKYVIGLQIVSVAILGLAVGALVGARGVGGGGQRIRLAVSGIVTALAASQVFGATFPALDDGAVSSAAPLIAHLEGTALRIEDPPRATQFILVVDELMEEHPGQRLLYVSVPSDGRTLPYVMSQWSLALTGMWTVQAQEAVVDLHLDESDSWSPSLESMITGIRRVLRADAHTVIVVEPAYRDQVRDLVDDPALNSRVVSW